MRGHMQHAAKLTKTTQLLLDLHRRKRFTGRSKRNESAYCQDQRGNVIAECTRSPRGSQGAPHSFHHGCRVDQRRLEIRSRFIFTRKLSGPSALTANSVERSAALMAAALSPC